MRLPRSQKGFAPVILLLLVVLVGVAGAGGYWYLSKQKAPNTASKEQDVARSIENTDKKDWKTYSDPNGEFSFQYPPTVKLKTDQEGGSNPSLSVLSQDINSIGEAPYGLDQETAIKDKTELANGQFGERTGYDLQESRKVIKLSNTYAKASTQIGQVVDVCGSDYVRRLIFYTANRRVIISLSIPENIVSSALPNYFTKDPSNCGDSLIYDSKKNLYQALAGKSVGGTVQEWFNTFDKIVNTVKISLTTTP